MYTTVSAHETASLFEMSSHNYIVCSTKLRTAKSNSVKNSPVFVLDYSLKNYAFSMELGIKGQTINSFQPNCAKKSCFEYQIFLHTKKKSFISILAFVLQMTFQWNFFDKKITYFSQIHSSFRKKKKLEK